MRRPWSAHEVLHLGQGRLLSYTHIITSPFKVWPEPVENHPRKPTQFSSLSRSMLWSTVSNTVLRSSSTSTDIFSEFKWISFIILMSTVSVLWCTRKPDLKLSRYTFEFKFSWLKTTFSIILPFKRKVWYWSILYSCTIWCYQDCF